MPPIKYESAAIPKLPQNLAKTQADPGVREGKSCYVELARNRTWGKKQSFQLTDFQSFYKKLYDAQPKGKVK